MIKWRLYIRNSSRVTLKKSFIVVEFFQIIFFALSMHLNLVGMGHKNIISNLIILPATFLKNLTTIKFASKWLYFIVFPLTILHKKINLALKTPGSNLILRQISMAFFLFSSFTPVSKCPPTSATRTPNFLFKLDPSI